MKSNTHNNKNRINKNICPDCGNGYFITKEIIQKDGELVADNKIKEGKYEHRQQEWLLECKCKTTYSYEECHIPDNWGYSYKINGVSIDETSVDEVKA